MLRFAATAPDERCDLLLAPLSAHPAMLRGLAAAAVAPRPGRDFPFPFPSSAPAPAPAPASGAAAASSAAPAPASAPRPAPPSPFGPDGAVGARQRESLRVLLELASLSFRRQLPAQQEPGSGAAMGAVPGAPPRMVDNRLHRHAGAE